MATETLLVTGATGMTGSHVVRRGVQRGYHVRAVVRRGSDRSLIADLDVEYVEGDLEDPASLAPAVATSDIVVHAAAKVGDWGPLERFRAINVIALDQLLDVACRGKRLKRWIQVSSLGVYKARHHYGTDETVPPDLKGLDGYTKSKAEAEMVLQRYMRQYGLPAVIVRPGYIYGPGDRHLVPRLIERLQRGTLRLIGDGKALMNNTYVGNLVDAIFLAIEKDAAIGQTFNIRDERLVTREQYIMTIANYLGKPRPRHVPVWLAGAVCPIVQTWAKLRGQTEPPLVTRATIKFMTLHFDFSIDKAKKILGYQPKVDFEEGMKESLDWATGRLKQPLPSASA